MIQLFIVQCHPFVAGNSQQHALSSWRFFVNPWPGASLPPFQEGNKHHGRSSSTDWRYCYGSALAFSRQTGLS
jgi:hypothetical protein